MGILDEAIREHLELKRQHGADDSELKQLEDDAFGQAERPGDEAAPDPFAEAPTEFMAAPEVGGDATAEVADEAPPQREAPDIASLQEAPEPPAKQSEEEEDFEGAEEEAEQVEEEPEPIAEEPTAMEHEVVPQEPESSGPSTEEREVIADQPTEMFDVEAELRETLEAAPADEPALEEEEEEDDFWDEQRLSDELNQALEAPVTEPTEVAEIEVEEEIVEVAEADEDAEEEEAPLPPIRGDQDVLEDTPDFLEDSEDDQLWFEQKPPKDFDFDD